MKKILLVPLSMLSISLIFAGCANNETTADIGRRLDSNLNNLTHIVTKLDAVDNNYIANPDLPTSAKTLTAKANNGKIYSLAFAESNNNTDNSSINDLIKQLLYNKLSERLTQNNNGKCRVCNQDYSCDHDGFCNNCNNKIICDNMGNCTNCGRHLVLTHDNKCANCNNTAIISESKCSKAVQRISTMNDDLASDTLNVRQIVNDIKNDKEVSGSDYKPMLLGLSDATNYESSYPDNTNPKHNHLYPRLKYNPRHITDLDSLDISKQIDSYIDKVQKLYAMSNDTIEANSILSECKNTLLETVASVRELNKEVINGTCVPSAQQVQALKNYIDDINNTVKRLKNCNGDITKQMNKINQTDNANVTTSVDVMNSNYISLLNHIDTRIAYHESAITTLEQIKYLLEDAINNGSIDENQLLEYSEKLTDITNYDEQQVEQDSATNLDEAKVQKEYIDEQDVDNARETNLETESQNDVDTESDDTTNNQTKLDNNEIIKNSNDNTDTNQDTQNHTNTSIKNIDTYNQTPLKNIDTYRNNNDINDNVTNNADVKNNNNTIDTNNVDDTNSTVDENIDNKNYSQVYDNNNSVDDSNSVNNMQSSQVVDNNPVNQNNNIMYQNGVINENNLNTQNNLQHRYYYGNDGKIYNNTTTLNDSNHLGNGLYNNTNGNYTTNGAVDNNINNNGEGLNNVNTYGYNSILDAINQGTVNNGINTL